MKSDPEPPSQIAPEEVIIRPFEPADTLEISRCAYMTYGYGYESFVPMKPESPCAIVCGKGKVAGRTVWCYAADPEVKPSPPVNSIAHQVAFFNAVAEAPHPVKMLIDAPAPIKNAGGKTPIPPGAGHLLAGKEGVGHTFYLQAGLRQTVLQIAVVLGSAGASIEKLFGCI